MNLSIRRSCFVLLTIAVFGLAACGSGDSSGTDTVSMSQENSQQETTNEETSSQQSTPERFQDQRESSSRSRSSGPVDVEAVMEETGVYPTEIKTFQSGFAQLTLNGELTINSIKMPENDGGFPTWPKDPGSERGQSDLIYFENFDLKKALNQALNNEQSRDNSAGSLEITGMRANAYKSDSLRGFMDVTFNEAFTVNGAKLMKSDDGFWVAWPSEKAEDGNYYDLVSGNKDLNSRVASMAKEEMDL